AASQFELGQRSGGFSEMRSRGPTIAGLTERKSVRRIPAKQGRATEYPLPCSTDLRHEFRPCGLLRPGAAAAMYELPDRAAFLGRDRSQHLCGMAAGNPAARHGLALSACAVLPLDVLVLRLPHHGRAPR